MSLPAIIMCRNFQCTDQVWNARSQFIVELLLRQFCFLLQFFSSAYDGGNADNDTPFEDGAFNRVENTFLYLVQLCTEYAPSKPFKCVDILIGKFALITS